MAGILSRRWRVGGILVCLAFMALPLSSAWAAGSTPTATGIQIGPIALNGGYQLTIEGSCNVPNAYTSVTVTKAGRGYTFTHSYYGAPRVLSKCTTSPKFGSGTMKLGWGKLTVNMKFGKAGARKRLSFVGCKGTAGHLRHVTGKGTLKMDIHPGAFGKLNLHKVKGEILIFDGHCGGGASPGGVSLSAGFGKNSQYVSGYLTPKGKRQLSAGGPDKVSRKIRGYVTDTFMGKRLFSFSSNLSSAKLSGFSPFLTGSLRYTALAPCSSGYSQGKLKGKMALHDPVVGTLRFLGRKAEMPSMYRANGTC